MLGARIQISRNMKTQTFGWDLRLLTETGSASSCRMTCMIFHAAFTWGPHQTPYLVAEWIHFTLLGIILPSIKLKVYTFGGL